MAKETKKEVRKEAKKEFNRRTFASVLAGFSFVIVVLTGLALFTAPSCRIARESGWAVWGYSKEELSAIHVWFAVIFAAIAIYHIYFNWGSIKRYFEGKASEGIGFRTEWVAALLICVVVYGGTVHGAWPFSSLMEWKESYKHGAVGQGQGWRGGRGGNAIRGGGGCGESGSCESDGKIQQGWRGGRGGALRSGSGCSSSSGSCESKGGVAAKGGSGCSASGSCEKEGQVQQGHRGRRSLSAGGLGCSESGGCES
ncbi:MAG: DUF4405 domain-containing protein, partial [Planctomycetota bacterium]